MWEEVCCVLGAAKLIVAHQIFMHWNNHILFYGKPFYFSNKNSWEFASSIFPESGLIRSITLRFLLYTTLRTKQLYIFSGLFFPWVQCFCDWMLISSHRPVLGQPLIRARMESPGEKRQPASGSFLHCSALFWWTVLCVAGGNSSVKPIFML